MENLPPLFFIIARGRSGTDLLRYIMDMHPHISVAPEGMFIINLYKKYKNEKKWDRKKLEAFYHDLFLEERLDQWWKLNKAKLKKDILSFEGKEVSFGTLCKLVYQNESEEKNKKEVCLLGDKNPTYSLFTEELASLYPESKFIVMVRDYRDNILSFQHVDFDFNNTAVLADRWLDYNVRINHSINKTPDRFLLIRYEDLLKEPDSILKRICDFLDADFDPGMLKFHHTGNKLNSWQKNISKPLNPNNAFKWKSKMEESDIIISDHICGKFAEKNFDYSPQFKTKHYRFLYFPAILLSRISTIGEKMIFSLPLKIRHQALTFYRKKTKTMH